MNYSTNNNDDDNQLKRERKQGPGRKQGPQRERERQRITSNKKNPPQWVPRGRFYDPIVKPQLSTFPESPTKCSLPPSTLSSSSSENGMMLHRAEEDTRHLKLSQESPVSLSQSNSKGSPLLPMLPSPRVSERIPLETSLHRPLDDEGERTNQRAKRLRNAVVVTRETCKRDYDDLLKGNKTTNWSPRELLSSCRY